MSICGSNTQHGELQRLDLVARLRMSLGQNRPLRQRSRCIWLQIDDQAATTHSKSNERILQYPQLILI